MSTELDEATVVERCQRSRASQGLPERITDGAVLSRIVNLALAPTLKRDGAGPAPPTGEA
jgi:hypothetical protein